MKSELELILKLVAHYDTITSSFTTFYRTQLTNNKELVITQCGIGKVNAALGTKELINLHKPDFIVSTGVAGGAQHDIMPLQIVVADSTTYHDVYCGNDNNYGQIQGLPTIFPSDKHLVEIAAENNNIRIGLITTGDWFVDTPDKALSILSHHPTALAFDMETCAIAQTCYLHSVPFISFRIISDNPLFTGNTQTYHDFFSQLSQGSFDTLIPFLQHC